MFFIFSNTTCCEKVQTDNEKIVRGNEKRVQKMKAYVCVHWKVVGCLQMPNGRTTRRHAIDHSFYTLVIDLEKNYVEELRDKCTTGYENTYRSPRSRNMFIYSLIYMKTLYFGVKLKPLGRKLLI